MEKSKQQSVSDQLERLGWRTTQREADSGYEQQATPGKWGAIISAILMFQNDHNGRSPSNPLIAQATGLSPGQVQYHMGQMEKRGLVIDKEGWPRRIIVTTSAKIAAQQEVEVAKPEEKKVQPAKATDSGEVIKRTKRDYAKGKKRESFMVMARRFAEYLTDHYDKYGEAPMIKDAGPALGYSKDKPVGLSRIVRGMVERGWLHHQPGHHRDHVLTGLGRAVLFGEVEQDLHTDMPIHPQPRPAVLARGFPLPIRPLAVDVRRAAGVPLMEEAKQQLKDPDPTLAKPETVIRTYAPQPTLRAEERFDLAKVETVDLVLELQQRGFRVTR